MTFSSPDAKPHLCASPDCDCGMTRRDFMRVAALSAAGAASPLLFAGDAFARQAPKGDDQPVRIGYLPITDATPLLVAHARGLFEAEGLKSEAPRLFRSWAQIIEAFIAGQVNVIHLLSPATLSVRYGAKFPGKVVAWNHVNGSALTVANDINSVADLGGKTVAIPFWYSIHNILLQQILAKNGLSVLIRGGDAPKANEVRLVVLAPSEMVSALAGRTIAGFIVAEPFNAMAETAGVGKVLRFSGDVWKNHACCVTFLSERDISARPEWAQRVTSAVVKAQLWTRSNQLDTAKLLSNGDPHRYTPHPLQVLSKVLTVSDFAAYEKRGVVAHRDWQQRRIDFQPFPFASYTQELVRAMRATKLDGNVDFLQKLGPAFVARDLVDDRFVRRAIADAGGPAAFGLPANLLRSETVSVW
jgi:NitT/TauT family transport system substrate-binding protein